MKQPTIDFALGDQPQRRLVVFDTNTIRSWGPCYDPGRYLPLDWQGTVVDILKDDRIPFSDRLWVVLRHELISDKLMRLFAVYAYRQTLAFVANPDPRSLKAVEVAEAYANGKATDEELAAAESAARSAARSAAWSAAWSAAESAAWSAAWSAAESAAWSAAESAWSAAESAAESAWSAARSEFNNVLRDKLIEMVLIGGNNE